MTRRLFIASRVDGLGCRLIAMLNAMALAERHGFDFAFSWKSYRRPFQAVADVDDMFAPDFVRAHRYSRLRRHVDRYILRRYVVTRAGASLAEIDRAVATSSGNIVVENPRPLQMGDDSTEQIFLSQYRRLFDTIRFSDKLERVRSFANALPLPDAPVGLHLRAGDVTHGKYRMSGHYFQLAISVPLARRILAQTRDAGRTALIFTQDTETARRLIAEFGGVFAPDLFAEAGFGDIEAALCEIILMSRCAAIHAAGSAFATLAAMIAGIPVSLEMSNAQLAGSAAGIVDWLNSPSASTYSDLAVAFAAWSAARCLGPEGDVEARLSLLASAASHDPTNPLYRIKAAALLLQAGRPGDADAELGQMLRTMDIAAVGWTDCANARVDRVARRLPLHYRIELQVVCAAARPEWANLSWMAAMAHIGSGDLGRARATATAALGLAPGHADLLKVRQWLARPRLGSLHALKPLGKRLRKALAER